MQGRAVLVAAWSRVPSLLLSSNVPLLYVSQQLGHAKPTTTLKHYAKWMPSGEQRFVNVLEPRLRKSWHHKLAPIDINEEEDSEVVEIWWAV